MSVIFYINYTTRAKSVRLDLILIMSFPSILPQEKDFSPQNWAGEHATLTLWLNCTECSASHLFDTDFRLVTRSRPIILGTDGAGCG